MALVCLIETLVLTMYFHFHSCKKCNTYYWDLERLRGHYSDCGRVQKKLPSQSLCDICGKGCQSESILRAHREIHSSDSRRVYECIMCKNRFLSRRGLEQHIVMKHVNDKPQFQCDTCGKEFTWKFRYVRHLKLHLNDFPFECSQCGKKFRFKDKLVVCKISFLIFFRFKIRLILYFLCFPGS